MFNTAMSSNVPEYPASNLSPDSELELMQEVLTEHVLVAAIR